MSSKQEIKNIACSAIDDLANELNSVSEDIWRNPELGLEETKAHDLLTDFLDKHGFKTQRSFKMPTAFKASYGDGVPNIGFISEYDALPEIGHACGHNLIAELGIAAACGLKAAIEKAKIPLGKVTLLGTPAEEGLGGKIDLIGYGAFDDVDVAMMAHPFPINDPSPVMLARESLSITYHGKASHAAAYPWEGVNALDAAVMCYQSLACLRQQIKPTWRIHCIIKHGGVKVNIIPEMAILQVAIRAPTDTEKDQLKIKVIECFKAAAMATGCTMEYALLNKPYSSMMHNKHMVALYESNMEALQTEKVPSTKSAICASTDMGNVSHVIPSIHPNFYIGGTEVNHTRGFADDAGAPVAQTYTLIQAKALVMTAIDIMMDGGQVLDNIKQAFQHDLKHAA